MIMELMDSCSLQVENEQIVRNVGKLQMEELAKMGALFYTARNRHADGDKIKESKEILKRKAGIFSNFRGNLEFAIRVRMSLETNPEVYIDHVMSIYRKLVEGRKLPGEILAMTAMTIYEQSNGQNIDQIITDTREAYAEIKQKHKFLSDESDMSFIALMVMCGKDVRKTLDEVEELYLALKDRYRMSSDTAQAAALVLSMSEKPVSEKVDDFVTFYQKLKEAKHHTSKGKAMSIYGAFADLDIPRETLLKEIGEVDDWLKQQKGYGILYNSDIRRTMAATLVLQYHEAEKLTSYTTQAASVVSQVIAEEVILTIIMIIVVTMLVNSTLYF